MTTLFKLIESYNCNKIKGIGDIEEISTICLNCNLHVSCQVKYLLETRKKSISIDIYRETNVKYDDDGDEPVNDLASGKGFEETNNDDDEPKCCLDGGNGCKIRSILVKKASKKNEFSSSTGQTMFCQTKKVVRFADSLGFELVKIKCIQARPSKLLEAHLNNLMSKSNRRRYHYSYEIDDSSEEDDLSDIKQGLNTNEDDVFCSDNDDLIASTESESGDETKPQQSNVTIQKDKKKLVYKIGFTQPCMDPKFMSKVDENKVMLESAYTSVNKWINGIVRVKNMNSNEKKVKIRYSIDNWSTYKEVDSICINNSNDTKTDRFNFRFQIDPELIDKQINSNSSSNNNSRTGFDLKLSVCYRSELLEYWDNNNNNYYTVECYSNSDEHKSLKHNSKSERSLYLENLD